MIKPCDFCSSCDHLTINCTIEKQMAPYFKKEVGNEMELFISKNIKCQICNSNRLKVLGNHTPSLDIICDCGAIYEVKAKCLSTKNLPDNIYCNGGNYNKFKENIINGLHLIIIIYGVNRKDKKIYIKHIYYIPNKVLINNSLIQIIKKTDSTLSLINIPNRNVLININSNKNILSFKNLYDDLKNKI